MDYIENFESELESAKNAQTRARIIDLAFQRKSDDCMDLGDDGLQLEFSYQDCLLGNANYASALFK